MNISYQLSLFLVSLNLEEKARYVIFLRQCFLRYFEAKCKETDELELNVKKYFKITSTFDVISNASHWKVNSELNCTALSRYFSHCALPTK